MVLTLEDDKNGKLAAEMAYAQPVASSSTPERQRFRVELPMPKQIYTTGSAVSGMIHLEQKDLRGITAIHAAIICTVRSNFHRYYGGYTHDVRRETTRLIEVDQVLWTRGEDDISLPPSDLPFQIFIPEFGNDKRGNDPQAPLPPSFHGGRHQGWSHMFTYGTPVGFVKYQVKAKITRDRLFNSKEKAYAPFVFLPPSPPPPLLPSISEEISLQDVDAQLSEQWKAEIATTTLRQSIFNNKGEAILKLWLPSVGSYPRATQIPFFLCLTLQTRQVPASVGETEPSSNLIPPPPLLDKAKVHLQRQIRVCARKGVQRVTKTYDKLATDNLLFGRTARETSWVRKNIELTDQIVWEKTYVWRGVWTFTETPNFSGRQLTWKYNLVAEVPIKGLTNDAKVVIQDLHINSGVISGQSLHTMEGENELDLPPDYFELDGGDDEDDDRPEKA